MVDESPMRTYTLTNPDPTSATTGSDASRRGNEMSASMQDHNQPTPTSPDDNMSPSIPESNDEAIDRPSAMTPASNYRAYTPVVITPSISHGQPPSSVPGRDILDVPPSLPQDYSVASMGSAADDYREFDRREEDERSSEEGEG